MSRAVTVGSFVVAIVALVAFLGVRGAALFDAERKGPKGLGTAESVGGATAETRPTFDDWPAPAAVLVLTGEQHGYLEPCGCSASQSGGLARRSDLMNKLRAKGWPVAGLDLGGTVERSRKQTELKFGAVASALRKLDYRGLGLGPEELALQPAVLMSAQLPGEEGAPGLAFLGANEVFFETPDLEGGPKRFTTFDLGGVKIGATMVLGTSRQKGIFPEGAAADVTFTPPAEALRQVVKDLASADSRINVLLAYADLEESRELAKQFEMFDIVVSAGGPEDPSGQPEKIGDTWLVTVGHKGKYAGVLGLYPNDEKIRYRYEAVDLNKERFDHDKAMDSIMAEYQQALQDNLSDVFADLPEGFPPGEGTYVGAAKCAECHKQAYEKWSTTGHARAYESLTKGRPDWPTTWIDRKFDPECLACHVTGWEPQELHPLASGFLPEAIAAERNEPDRFALLQGQQCENCHRAGSKHVEVFERWMKDPKSVSTAEQAAANALVKVDRKAAQESLCVRCHDYENSPTFNFDEYWAKVQHTGLRN